MFDFAIAQHQRHHSTRLVLFSRVLSVLIHFAVVVTLIEHPELLSTGFHNWLRHFPVLVTSTSSSPPVTGGSRLVTNLVGGPMERPSDETLRRYTYDFDRKETGTMPPIQVTWGGQLSEEKKPATKPVMGKEEPKPAGGDDQALERAANPAVPAGGAPGQPGALSGGTGEGASAGGTGQVVPLPAPDAAPKQIPKNTETAANTAPAAIPPAVAPPSPKPPATTPSTAKVDRKAAEQQVIQAEGSGLFDTKGFPLGDYANIVIERVKGNWAIPSNLRNSQGRTTVIFYIDKNGRFSDARIVASSGSSSLDYAALSAVIGSNPFPPLPKGFPGDHVGAKFVFSYNERQ
jgi:protein TonB